MQEYKIDTIEGQLAALAEMERLREVERQAKIQAQELDQLRNQVSNQVPMINQERAETQCHSQRNPEIS